MFPYSFLCPRCGKEVYTLPCVFCGFGKVL
jgi:ribosomal protein L37E